MKGYILLGHVEKVTFKSRQERVNIVVTGEVNSWVSLPQNKGLCEESVRLQLTLQQWNTKGMLIF